MDLGKIIEEELNWGKTENGEEARTSTANKCLDFFGRIGSMRECDEKERVELFRKAFAENPEIATKLLFYTRDIREGYGERTAFTDILRDMADREPLTVIKNLPYIMEFGRFKDLYCLVDTKCEKPMFEEMKKQWDEDMKNLKEDKDVSLLAKWIATPNASSEKTAHLAVKTAYALGYDKTTMKQFRKDLSALRAKLDLVEKHMALTEYDKIDYSKIPSKCGLVHKEAFKKHDGERYNEFINSVNKGETKINVGTLTPVDIVHRAMHDSKEERTELDTMWENLNAPKEGYNVLSIVDTSGSMTCGRGVLPIEASVAMGLYFSEHNTGCLKNYIMTFSERPEFVSLKSSSCLKDKINEVLKTDWGCNTNLKAAYEKLLDLAKTNNMPQEEMPEAIVVISDMQIDSATQDCKSNGHMDFHQKMKNLYEENGYKLPHCIYWNVNAERATFLAAHSEDSVSLVSGYSPNVFNQIINNIGKTPEDLMMSIVNSERYSMIHAYEPVHRMKEKEFAIREMDLAIKEIKSKKRETDDMCL